MHICNHDLSDDRTDTYIIVSTRNDCYVQIYMIISVPSAATFQIENFQFWWQEGARILLGRGGKLSKSRVGSYVGGA